MLLLPVLLHIAAIVSLIPSSRAWWFSEKGDCMCNVKGNYVNVRRAACGETVGCVNKGQCFRYLDEAPCKMNNKSYDFYNIKVDVTNSGVNEQQNGWVSKHFFEKVDDKENSPCDELNFHGVYKGFKCHGNVLDIKESKGASKQTAKDNNVQSTGVRGSQEIITINLPRLEGLRNVFEYVGQRLCVEPALIAAIASRETQTGALLNANCRSNSVCQPNCDQCKTYGILNMECQLASTTFASVCEPWREDFENPITSRFRYVETVVEKVLLNDKLECVKKKHPSWKPEQHLKGAVAAFGCNTPGCDSVRSLTDLAHGCATDDYADDVIARAQFLMNEHLWGAPLTFETFIRIVRDFETQQFEMDIIHVTNAIYALAYPAKEFRYSARFPDNSNLIHEHLGKEHVRLLIDVTQHSERCHNVEIGVLRTPQGDTVAMGHVIAGIAAGLSPFVQEDDKDYGFKRWLLEWNVDDVVNAVTLAGDLAQSALTGANRLGPGGSWDSLTLPKVYTLTGSASEATDAEIIGNLDGIILGYLVTGMRNRRLSDILEAYYSNEDGVGLGYHNSYKASNRVSKFFEFVSDTQLWRDVRNTADALEENVFSTSMERFRLIVERFFELPIMCDRTNDFFTMTSFKDFVTRLEEVIENQHADDMIRRLIDRETDFPRPEIYIADKYLTESDPDFPENRYSGVVLDSDSEESVSIKTLFDHLHKFIEDPKSIDEFRELGKELLADNGGQLLTIGERGTWTRCPPRFTSSDRNKRSGVIASIDAILIAKEISFTSSTLSTILNDYYFGDGIGDDRIKSTDRLFKFKDFVDNKSGKHKRDVETSMNFLQSVIREVCDEAVVETPEEVAIRDCKSYSQRAAHTFFQFINEETNMPFDAYGDLMKLTPSGASYATSTPNTPGVDASRQMVGDDLSKLSALKRCFIRIANQTGIHPALGAALASRASRVGLNLDGRGYNKNGNGRYGIMQCQADASQCTVAAPTSCEHMQAATAVLERLVGQVKAAFPQWAPEQWLQGAVAAYDVGIETVKTRQWKRVDAGTENEDFSNDVIARAQWLVSNHGWNFGLSASGQSSKPPGLGLLLANYPAYPGHNVPLTVTDTDLTVQMGEPGASSTDSLRLCYMLNRIPGHHVDHAVAGGQVTDSGDVYYSSVIRMHAYLKERYGPPLVYTSISDLHSKYGILHVSGRAGGQVGLWNGNGVYGASDFTADGEQFSLWETAADCRALSESPADCEFYKMCVESRRPCGADGYALGYGFKYCQRFEEHKHLFTDQGKVWINEVRTCLKRKLLPYTSMPGISCKKLRNVAFQSHFPCYVDSGFCEIILNINNIKGLLKVFDKSDFFSLDALTQIFDTLGYCGYNALENFLGLVTEWFGAESGNNVTPVDEARDECTTYAQDGDCRFYECLRSRFPCGLEDDRIQEFELPSCLEFYTSYDSFSHEGKSWLKSYQRCLMAALLPLYQSPGAVNCYSITAAVVASRAACLRDAGLCAAIKHDALFIDRSMDDHGYPLITRRRGVRLPLSDVMHYTDVTYYERLQALRYQVGAVAGGCSRGGGLYKMVYSDKHNLNVKIEL